MGYVRTSIDKLLAEPTLTTACGFYCALTDAYGVSMHPYDDHSKDPVLEAAFDAANKVFAKEQLDPTDVMMFAARHACIALQMKDPYDVPTEDLPYRDSIIKHFPNEQRVRLSRRP